jgi:hypothetical protein
MDKVRHYFQHHPIVHWLVSVAITFTILMSGGVLLHEKNWPLLIVWSIGVPTVMAATRAMRK